MSDNTPFSGSAGPHLGKKRGFSAWITGADQSATIKTNLGSLTKAGQALKKNILQHKGEDTAGCSVGVRELGDDGFTRYNIEGEAIFITKRSTDVFSDDEFVDAGSEQFIGRRLSSVEVPKEAAEPAPAAGPSTFVPDIGTSPAPKTFKGMGYRETPASARVEEAPVRQELVIEASPASVVPSNSASIMDKVAKRVPRIETPIDWSEQDSDDTEDIFISQSESSVPEAVSEPVADVEDVQEDIMDVPVEDPVTTIVESPVEEFPVVEAEPSEVPVAESDFEDSPAEVPVEVPVEIPVAAADSEDPVAEPPVEDPVTVVPTIGKVEAEPIGEVLGLYSEGDAKSGVSVSSGIAVEKVASVNTSSAAEAPKDLTAYGINGMTDPQIARPRPRYRTYKISGGRICDSATVEGRKEGPQRPLD